MGFFNAVLNFIVKECIWSLRQVRKRQLLEAGLVQYGLKDRHANTYSISKIGIKKIGEYADEE